MKHFNVFIKGEYQDVIYLPDEIGKHLHQYRATLGHKINHSFYGTNNCRFEVFNHARFGLIHAVKSTWQIKKDEELLCPYNLPYDISAPWYQELWRQGLFQKLLNVK